MVFGGSNNALVESVNEVFHNEKSHYTSLYIVTSVQNDVADINYFMLQKIYRFIDKVINVISRVIYYFNPIPTFLLSSYCEKMGWRQGCYCIIISVIITLYLTSVKNDKTNYKSHSVQLDLFTPINLYSIQLSEDIKSNKKIIEFVQS